MPLAAPAFTQVSSLPLYALSTTSQSGLSGYWVGYRPSPAAGFGTTATLDQVWQDAGGVYLFLGQTPASFAAFQTAFDALRPNLPPSLRFIWLPNPNDSVGYWQLQTLLATASGTGARIAWQVARQARLELGAYALEIEARGALSQANPSSQGYGSPSTPASSTSLHPAAATRLGPGRRGSHWTDQGSGCG
jgi:hypothetical protein